MSGREITPVRAGAHLGLVVAVVIRERPLGHHGPALLREFRATPGALAQKAACALGRHVAKGGVEPGGSEKAAHFGLVQAAAPEPLPGQCVGLGTGNPCQFDRVGKAVQIRRLELFDDDLRPRVNVGGDHGQVVEARAHEFFDHAAKLRRALGSIRIEVRLVEAQQERLVKAREREQILHPGTGVPVARGRGLLQRRQFAAFQADQLPLLVGDALPFQPFQAGGAAAFLGAKRIGVQHLEPRGGRGVQHDP